MVLNPFFLQGSPGEQRLIQDLINEQLKIYGVEVTYIPRRFIDTDQILNEVQISRFDDNFLIEAYISTYEGHTGAGDILTKFGMSLRDEVTLIISQERFEDFISPLMADSVDPDIGDYELIDRPREGDLIYFPLGKRLFEVKFVEHEKPFYQLQKNYVYELKCELFEYQDEVIDTSNDEIDALVADEGYIKNIYTVGVGSTATATAILGTGYIDKIYLNNDGYGYQSAPTISFTASPQSGGTAVANAEIVTVSGTTSLKQINLINCGFGYTEPPSVIISGGGGIGAAATCSINTTSTGVIGILINSAGVGYGTTSSVTIESPGTGVTATATSIIATNTGISTAYINNPGSGYITEPLVVLSTPEVIGIGTFEFNEIITGSKSGTTARVKKWKESTGVLQVSYISNDVVGFLPGESITGTASSASYTVKSFDTFDEYDEYDKNSEFQTEADLILDFTEVNPFGTY